MKFLPQWLVGFPILIIIIGCAGVPTQEMSDARQAIKAAREVIAQQVTPISLLTSAEHSLTQAEENLKAGYLGLARHQALLAKEQAVKAYDLVMSLVQAKTIWKTILSLGYPLDEQANLLLAKAEQAVLENDIDHAISLANQTYHEGQLALNRAYLQKTKLLIDKMRDQQTQLLPTQRMTLEAAFQAYRQQDGQKAYKLMINLFHKASPPP